MDSLSKKYLNLLSEYEKLRKRSSSTGSYIEKGDKPKDIDCDAKLQNWSNAYSSLYERKELLKKEIKTLYGSWFPPKIKSFFSTLIPWIKKGFKISKLGEYRLELCKKCEFFTERKSCEVCGCHMEWKAKIPQASCPLGKWKAEKSKDTTD